MELFENIFDLNNDGELDAVEVATGFAVIDSLLDDTEKDNDLDAFDDDDDDF